MGPSFMVHLGLEKGPVLCCFVLCAGFSRLSKKDLAAWGQGVHKPVWVSG